MTFALASAGIFCVSTDSAWAAQTRKTGQVRDDLEDVDQPKAKRKPTLLPAWQRRNRSSTPPPVSREEREAPRTLRRAIVPTPLPYARDVPGDRGPPLGVPEQYDPQFRPAGPTIGTPPLPPTRQVPGESGIPLGVGPLSPVR